MKDKRAKAIMAAILFLLIAGIWYRLWRASEACEAKGGVLVSGVARMQCVKEQR